MPQSYSQKREIHLKLVFYGPAGAGKTSALNYLYRSLRPDIRGQLVAVSTGNDRTLFFDFFPAPPPRLLGTTIHIQIYTAPGTIHNDSTRRALLAGVDGVLFIADSQKGREQENLQSFEQLRSCLSELSLPLEQLGLVMSWNKRDLPDACPVGELESSLNTMQAPSFSSVAKLGQGVFEAFRALASLSLESALKRRPEAAASAYGPRSDPAHSSDLVTTRRTRATKEAQRALAVLSSRYAVDPAQLLSTESAKPAEASSERLDPTPAPTSSPRAPSAERVFRPSSPSPALEPPREMLTDGRSLESNPPTEPTIPIHVMPLRNEVEGAEDPLGLRRPVPPPPPPQQQSAGSERSDERSGERSGEDAAQAQRARRTPMPSSQRPLEAMTPASGAVSTVSFSQLLQPGSLRAQLQDVERQLWAGQFTTAVRRAAGIFYALTAGEATREPDEGPAWRGLVLGIPVDRYLRFRQAVHDAESAKTTAEDALFALFFLLDAILRKDTWLPRNT